MGWLEDTVWVAERCAGQGLLFEAQVGGSEPSTATCGSAPQVQRTVFRPLRSRDLVIGAAEDAALPRPPIATRMCCKPSVARPGLKLGPVEPITRHRLQDGHLTHPAVRVEVQSPPQCRVDRTTLRSCRDMGDGPLLSRQRAFHPSHSSMVAHPASCEVWTRRLEAPERPFKDQPTGQIQPAVFRPIVKHLSRPVGPLTQSVIAFRGYATITATRRGTSSIWPRSCGGAFKNRG